jgi:isoleucyl-tRNA synthetase
MFEPVSSRVNFPQLETSVLDFWKKRDIMHRSMAEREGAASYVFYEGPPTANGLPGIHHVLSRAFKDLFPRYKTMRGYYCLRRGGWDTHGLPVELEVEKELGLESKSEIEKYGVAEFNERCKQSVFRYVNEWEQLTERIAFWVDLETAYVTMTNDYIESVWWILKQLWDKDLLYQDYKVVPYCPRCGTPLSDHEVALGYEENTPDPSIFVRFPVKGESGTYFLVWTTTPWTLPGNVALAVGPDVTYVTVEQKMEDGAGGSRTEKLILAKDLLTSALHGEYKVLEEYKGKKLLGKRYLPLFTFLPVDKDYCYVIEGSFVSTTDGTGIVHIAPAFGAEDMQVGREHDLPVLMTVDSRGEFIAEVKPWRGLFVKDADPLIIRELTERGLMYFAGTYLHTYPFCWRCHTPLLYYARATWYIQTTRFKENLVRNNEKITWYPEHIKDGRFGNWLTNNVDWALGRERYWGTPLPVWVCDDCGHKECIGGFVDLRKRVESAGNRWPESWDPHRPYVDAVVFDCSECKSHNTMHRVPELIDVWFDSGSMPVAQWHYPFENQETFKAQFPADYICEAVDQTRGWFYTLHAISTMLFDEPCFKNVICLGLVLDGEGQKMSKSKGNVVRPLDVINTHGADALRWYLYAATPPGNERRFSSDLVGEVVRTFMLTLWNTYSFFVTYANLDKWAPQISNLKSQISNELDRWVLSELDTLTLKVSDALEQYDVTGAARPIALFVNDLSNWYVRRSRRRFWKSGDGADKRSAYATLYECLVTLSKLLAPFMPFTAEAMYRNLVGSVDKKAPESVHLAAWPQVPAGRIDEQLMSDTRLVMKLVSLGHAARNSAHVKVRQPLAKVAVHLKSSAEAAAIERLREPLLDELNVKSLEQLQDATDVAQVSLNLFPQQLGKKFGPKFPALRAAVAKMDQAQLARELQAGKAVRVPVEGEELEIAPSEAEVKVAPKAGWAVATEAGYTVAVSTELTTELVQEGLAREVVRRVQDLRKKADFRIEDRITTYYTAEGKLAEAITAWANYIKAETLTEELVVAGPPHGAIADKATLDGDALTLAVRRR